MTKEIQMFSKVCPHTEKHRCLLWQVPLLWLLVILLYAGTLSSPLVLDDEISLTNNPHVRYLWLPSISFQAPPQNPLSGRPLVSFSFAVNHALAGLDPLYLRAGNLLIHLINSMMVLLLLRRLLLGISWLNGPMVAWTVALIWAVHPVNVDAVQYVTQRTELMASFFLLSCMLLTLRGFESPRPLVWLAGAVATCALGMLSKEIMAAAPLLVLLLDHAFISGTWRALWRRHKVFHLAMASTWIILIILNISDNRDDSVGFHHGVTAWMYLQLQSQVIVWYLSMIYWPTGLSIHHELTYPQQIWQWLPQFLLLGSLGAVTLYSIFRHPRLGFAGACFFLILAPTSSILPIITETMAERRMYLPGLSVMALTVIGYAAAIRDITDTKWKRAIIIMPATFAIVMMLVLTSQRLNEWQSVVRVYQTVLQVYPHSAKAHNNLGVEYMRQGQRDLAMKHFVRAYKYDPKHLGPPMNIAVIHMLEGEYDQCLELLNQLMPHFQGTFLGKAMGLKGKVFYEKGDWDDSIQWYEKAVEQVPYLAFIWNEYATPLEASGRLDDAALALEMALMLEPWSEVFHRRLAMLQTWRGHHEESLLHLQWHLTHRPDHPQSAKLHDLAAINQMILGRPVEALAHYTQAIALEPENGVIQGRFVRVLVEMQQYDQAQDHLNELLSSDLARHPSVLDAWARLLQATGEDEKAQEVFAQAQQQIQLREELGLPSLEQEVELQTESDPDHFLHR